VSGVSTAIVQLRAPRSGGVRRALLDDRASQLSASRCVAAYRLRWQIELQFKRWKTLCNFDRLPNYRDDTIRSC